MRSEVENLGGKGQRQKVPYLEETVSKRLEQKQEQMQPIRQDQ